MNRVYSLAALLLIGGSLSAQRVANAPLRTFEPAVSLNSITERAIHPAISSSRAETVVFSEDFANGLAGNNDFGPWSTTGTNGNVWKRTTTGNNGTYSAPNHSPLASTTASNGWMIFDSDSANTNWSDTSMISPPVQLVGSLESPIMDLSATPSLELRFYQRLRYCCRQSTGHYVDVSTDGGQTWPTRIAVDNHKAVYVDPNTDLATNIDSGTRLYAINLHDALAADPGNVKIRFTQEGNSDNALTHYFWQIDDIELVTLPGADLKMYRASSTFWNGENSTYDSLPYTIFPISELRPRGLSMGYFNNSAGDAHNVVASFSTDDGYNQSVSLGDVPVFSWDTAHAPAPGWTPTASLGVHNIYFQLSSDSVDATPENNADTLQISVSDFIYARDADRMTSSYSDYGTTDQPFKVGNMFHVNVDETLYGIDIAISPESDLDFEMNAMLLDDQLQPLAETGYHTIVATDTCSYGGNKFVSFIFDEAQQLTAGGDYFVCAQSFGGAHLEIGESGTSPASSSFLYSTTQPSGVNWYYTTSTPMVRMNFNSNIGIGEGNTHNGVGLGQNYPNPANGGSTRIDFSLDQAALVTMELRDISGKLVQTLVSGNMAQGVHHVDVNTANLGAGVYFYTLTTGKNTSTKRMTVVR